MLYKILYFLRLVRLPIDFDRSAYLELNPDLNSSAINPELHYLKFGRHEGRRFRYAAVLPEDFQPELYLALNDDLREKNVDPVTHYRLYGALEGRVYRVNTPIPTDFDAETYQKLNPDVLVSSMSPEIHFMAIGRKSGLSYKKVVTTSWPKVTQTEGESLLGYNVEYRDDPVNVDPKLIAFYLPQYHQIPENDLWWGEGFTEWTNVRKAKPNFVGHQQPRVPEASDYYDLTDVNVQIRQARLAKEYGLAAFCYYMYWFDGRRILERPLDQMLETPAVDIPFCICWANENWTRTWDGKADDVLLAQTHTLENDRRFITDAMKYLADPRYLRIDGKLTLLVYRVDLLPDAAQTAAVWREEVRKAGLGELHLCAVQFYGVSDPGPWGFDAAVEFPPHGWLVQENLPDEPPELLNPDFKGYIFDYDKSVQFALRKPIPDYTWYRGVFPGWDNTARRQDTSHIFKNSNAMAFEHWLTEVLRQTVLMAPAPHQVVFINAWNEWGEGAHLEPDEATGKLNLMAVHSALARVLSDGEPLSILSRLRRLGNYSERDNDEQKMLNLLRGKEQSIKQLVHMIRDKAK